MEIKLCAENGQENAAKHVKIMKDVENVNIITSLHHRIHVRAAFF